MPEPQYPNTSNFDPRNAPSSEPRFDFNNTETNPKGKFKNPFKRKIKWYWWLIGGMVVFFIVFFIVALILRDDTPTQDTGTQEYWDTKVTLTWLKPKLPGQNIQVFEEIADSFTNLYPNAKIEIVNPEYDDEDYYNDLIKSIARRTGPDIFTIRNDDLPAYKDFMSPINAFSGAKLADYKDNFVDLVVRDTMIQDQVYGVTMYVDNLQLYYNETLLQQNNISIPAQSWEDIDKQIPLLRKKDITDEEFILSPISLGTGGLLGDEPNIEAHQDIIPTLIFQRGGQLYDYANNSNLFTQNNATDTSGAIARSIQYYTDFSDPFSERYSWSTDSSNNLDSFVEGNLAYMINYKEATSIIENRNPRLNYGVTKLPQYNSSNKKTFGKFFMDGISKSLEYDTADAPKKFWAEQFLAYIAAKQDTQSNDAQFIFTNLTKLPAARKDIIDIQLNESEKAVQIFAEGSLIADNYYKPGVLNTEQIWTDLIEDLTIKNSVFDDAIRIAASKYQLLIKRGPTMR